MYCRKCRNEINEDDIFCPKCGTKVEFKEKTYKSKKIYIKILSIITIIVIVGMVFYINEKNNQNKSINQSTTTNNKDDKRNNNNNIEGIVSESLQYKNMFQILSHNYEYDESNKTLRIYGTVKNISKDRYEVSVVCNIYNEVYRSVQKSSPKYLLAPDEECNYEIIHTYGDYKPIKYQIVSFSFTYRPDYRKINNLSSDILNDTRFKITSYNWDNDINNKNLRIYGKIKNITSERYEIRVWARLLDEGDVLNESLISDDYILNAGEESDFEILYDYKHFGKNPLNYQILRIEYYLK